MCRALSLLVPVLIAAGLWTGPSGGADAELSADVVVYGGTASGVIAAAAAAREGKKVILIEPGRHLGGMVSGGLGATDTGNRACIGGYSREFFNRVREHYVKEYGANSQQVKDCSDGFRFEPHVAAEIFGKMVDEAKVPVVLGHRLIEAKKIGGRIQFIDCVEQAGAGRKVARFRGKVFIDASYEGDLLARAGVQYAIGREGRSQYDESLAGVQARSPAHQWPVPVPGLDDAGKLLPCIQNEPLAEPGTGDRKVQAYNFRLCMTNRKDNLVPWPKPAGYDPKRYELLARYLARKPDLKLAQLCNPVRVPNDKTDTNNNGAFSTDHIGANWDYPDGDVETRQRIWRDHVDYTQGFFWFLAHDPRVPRALQDEVNSWGLARDEFTDTNHWPHQLYVREARRMIGAYIMTQADIMADRSKEDSVGLGSYNTDSHHVQRILNRDGNVLNEGDFQVGVRPYAIPYRSLIPKQEQCTNLLVPVCCSASHVAYGTIRMEPVYMILGQASGVAAALASTDGLDVQAVSVPKLQDKLKAQRAVLSPETLAGSTGPNALDPARLAGIVIDDAAAKKVGSWVASSAIPGYVGSGYLHDDNEDKGGKQIRYTPNIPAAGQYEVFLYYTPNANRATNVPVVIHIVGEVHSRKVNQRLQPGDKGRVSLGKFFWPAGNLSWVEIRTEGTDGHVIGDAVQWVRVK